MKAVEHTGQIAVRQLFPLSPGSPLSAPLHEQVEAGAFEKVAGHRWTGPRRRSSFHRGQFLALCLHPTALQRKVKHSTL